MQCLRALKVSTILATECWIPKPETSQPQGCTMVKGEKKQITRELNRGRDMETKNDLIYEMNASLFFFYLPAKILHLTVIMHNTPLSIEFLSRPKTSFIQ